MYEEIVESTMFGALYIPPSLKEYTQQELLKAKYVKRIVKEVLEQKQVMTILKEALSKGFPLSNELLWQSVQPRFKLP